MGAMNEQEIFDFLQDGTRTAHVATVRADGRPHVKPVWFVLEGAAGAFSVILNTGAGTVTGRTLARDARVALTVDDAKPPFSFVIVEGAAALVDDLAQVRSAAGRIGARYMGADRAEEFAARNGVPGELLVRVTPNKVFGVADLAA